MGQKRVAETLGDTICFPHLSGCLGSERGAVVGEQGVWQHTDSEIPEYKDEGPQFPAINMWVRIIISL